MTFTEILSVSIYITIYFIVFFSDYLVKTAMKANINKYSHGYDIELFHCKSRLSKISIQSRDSPSLKDVKNAKETSNF